MSQEKIVLSNWLTNRFEIDAAARNKKVENRFLELLANRQRLNLVDLGSGTGGNLLYLLPTLKCDQIWHLVEQDDVLIKACQKRLGQMFNLKQVNENEVSFSNKCNRVHIKWYHTDIVDFLNAHSNRNNFDIVTASALFDILPKSTFRLVLDFVRLEKCALFGTLNYENTIFKNATETDLYYAKLYQQHMKLPQTYGIKMGGDCKANIMSLLDEREKQQLVFGKSNWVLNNKQQLMLKELIQFFSESVPDLLGLEEEHQAFKSWIDLKNQQINNFELSMIIEHFDFLLNYM